MESFFVKLLSIDKKGSVAKKSVINFLVSQAATITLLVVTMIINMGLFAGTVAGILTVPTIIFINAATEGFGITHNNFE
jgi:spore maturation protein SpmA